MKPGAQGDAIFRARRRRQAYGGQLALAEDLGAERLEDWTADDWATPWELIRELEAEFGPFALDPCCRAETAKAPRFFTLAEDGLKREWYGSPVFVNPPFSNITEWLKKSADAASRGSVVVCLIPVRTEMDWWHDLVLPFAEVRFQRGRPRFIGEDGTTNGRPWFAVAYAIYRPVLGEPT